MTTEMEESAKAVQEIAKATTQGIEAASKLGQFTAGIVREPIEIITGILSDKLRFVRWKRQIRLVEKCNEIMLERGITETKPVPPKIALPIIENASLEENDSLQDIWARLLVTAADPRSQNAVRTAFIDILKNLEPNDAIVLKHLYKNYRRYEKFIKSPPKKGSLTRTQYMAPHVYLEPHTVEAYRDDICKIANITRLEEYYNCIDNLKRVGCLVFYQGEERDMKAINGDGTTYIAGYDIVSITSLGVSLVEACIANHVQNDNHEKHLE